MVELTTTQQMERTVGITSDHAERPPHSSAPLAAFSSYRNISQPQIKRQVSPQSCVLSQHDGMLVISSPSSQTVVSCGRLGPITLTAAAPSDLAVPCHALDDVAPAPATPAHVALSVHQPDRAPARATRLRGVIFDRSEAGMAAAERMSASSPIARVLLERWAVGRDRFAVCIETDAEPGMIGGSARDFPALMDAVLPGLLDAQPNEDPCKFAFAVARNIHDELKSAVESRPPAH